MHLKVTNLILPCRVPTVFHFLHLRSSQKRQRYHENKNVLSQRALSRRLTSLRSGVSPKSCDEYEGNLAWSISAARTMVLRRPHPGNAVTTERVRGRAVGTRAVHCLPAVVRQYFCKACNGMMRNDTRISLRSNGRCGNQRCLGLSPITSDTSRQGITSTMSNLTSHHKQSDGKCMGVAPPMINGYLQMLSKLLFAPCSLAFPALNEDSNGVASYTLFSYSCCNTPIGVGVVGTSTRLSTSSHMGQQSLLDGNLFCLMRQWRTICIV
jgi:hypothetical protein